jgi:hypothetical protein
MRHNNRQLTDIRRPHRMEPVDPASRSLREDGPTYYRILARVCPLERWAVIAHRAVTAAEKGDARAREWLSGLLLGTSDHLIEEVTAASAFALVRQVIAAVSDVAERVIGDEQGCRTFRHDLREALTRLLPRGLVEESTPDTDQGPPEFIMGLARDLGPDVTDKLFKGFLAYLVLRLRNERGEELPLRGGLGEQLRDALDAVASAADEDSAEAAADEPTP